MQQKQQPTVIKTTPPKLPFLENLEHEGSSPSMDIPDIQQESQLISIPTTKLQKSFSNWSLQQTPTVTPRNGMNGVSSPPILNFHPSVSCDYLDLNNMNGNTLEINTIPHDKEDDINIAMNIQSFLGLQDINDAAHNNQDNDDENDENDNDDNDDENEYQSEKSFKSLSSSGSSESCSSSGSSEASTEQQSYTHSELSRIADNIALNQYGYKVLNVISNTVHGCVYEAKMYEIKEENDNDDNNINKVHKVNKVNKPRNSISLNGQKPSKQRSNSEIFEHVAIKKVDKSILEINEKIEMDNTHNIDGENIIKEAIILNYLSVMNTPPCSNNIVKFIDFIETDSAYYLVEEYGGTQTLAQFIKNAHQYIKEKKLKLKNWRITVKFIFWQISVLLYWMHSSMNVCHLDINANNILIGNGNFYENQKDGSITVDSKGLNVKLSDFGFGEIFPFKTNSDDDDDENDDDDDDDDDDDEKKSETVSFQCVKRGITKDHHHKCPQQFNGLQRFDARKSDCYSLGVLLYEMLTGSKPYQYPSPDEDDGYLALQTKEFQNYLINNGLSKHVYRSTLSLVEGLLNIDEEERMNTKQILNHEWFKHYYLRYKSRIHQKQQSQIIRHQRQAKKMQILPYYTLKNNNNNKQIKQCTL